MSTIPDPTPSAERRARKLGDILVKQGLLTREQLEQALFEQSRTDKLLGKVVRLSISVRQATIATREGRWHWPGRRLSEKRRQCQ